MLYSKGDSAMDISVAIRTIRKKTFLSQTAFANELSVAFSTVNRWENGKGIPNTTAMRKLREFCSRNSISCVDLEDAWINGQLHKNNE